MSSAWRMEKPCVDCPFNAWGPGLHLRKTLGRRRWSSILAGLRAEQSFTCHKTTHETGDDSNLMCAGAIAWQNKRGISSNLQRCCEAVDYFAEQRRKRGESAA